MKNEYEKKESINEYFKQEKKQKNIKKIKDFTLFENSKNFISKEIYFSNCQQYYSQNFGNFLSRYDTDLVIY